MMLILRVSRVSARTAYEGKGHREINNLTVRAPFQPVAATTEGAMVHAVYALRGQLTDELPHTD